VRWIWERPHLFHNDFCFFSFSSRGRLQSRNVLEGRGAETGREDVQVSTIAADFLYRAK